MPKHVLNIREATRLVAGVRLADNPADVTRLADALEIAIAEIKMHRRCADAIDEALNSGDGAYKP